MNTGGRVELAGMRVIRRLVPPEVPWPASLVRTADGNSRMLVDASILGDWNGWDAPAAGHVLAPLDVVRRADGHDVMFPLCVERIQVLLDRRGAVLPLTAGETVTLAVSAVRGAVEITARTDRPSSGAWWLTDDGRPVFVDDSDDEPAAVATVRLLERLAQQATGPLAEAVRAAVQAVGEPRSLIREADALEDGLFALAAAEPLATAPLARARIGRLRATEPPAAQEPMRRSWWQSLAGAVDADLADAFSLATTGVWRRFRSATGGRRRRPWALAGGLAALVIAGGLLWPAPDGTAQAGEGAASATPAATTTGTPPVQPAPSSSPALAEGSPRAGGDGALPADSPGETPADLVTAVDSLLETRRACLAGGTPDCLIGILEDPSRPAVPGIVDEPTAERTLTLLDDFGAVAVLRADPVKAGPSAQLLTVVRHDDRWLLRDVHDITQQP